MSLRRTVAGNEMVTDVEGVETDHVKLQNKGVQKS